MDESQKLKAEEGFAKSAKMLAEHKEWYDDVIAKVLEYGNMSLEERTTDILKQDSKWCALCDALCNSPGNGAELRGIGDSMVTCHTNLHHEMNHLRAQFAALISRYGGGGSLELTQHDMNMVNGKSLLQRVTGPDSLEYKLVDSPDAAKVH